MVDLIDIGMAGDEPPVVRFPVVLPEEDRLLLAKPSNPLHSRLPQILDLSERGLLISLEELFAYALFEEWDDRAGWRSYRELALKVPDRRKRFEDFLRVEDDGIRFDRQPLNSITEAIGIGAALAVSSRILGVTEADFAKIPEVGGKRQDFRLPFLASDGTELFEVEAKGTHDATSAARQRRSIREKKAAIRNAGRKVALLGVSCDVSYERQKASYLTVYDPPERYEEQSADYVRFVNRLEYYHRELYRISTRSPLTLALANRIYTIKRLGSEWRRLDGVPLVNARGESLVVSPGFADVITLAYHGRRRAHGRLFDLRLTSHASASPDVFETVRSTPQKLYFRGLLRPVLHRLVDQRVDEINAMRFDRAASRVVKYPRSGAVQVLASGVVAGIVRDDEWDDERLTRVLRSLRLLRKSRRLDVG